MVLGSEKGQYTLEAMLLMTVLMAATGLGIQFLNDKKVFALFIETPWERTSGMIECGVWGPPAQVRAKCPYHNDRFYSTQDQ